MTEQTKTYIGLQIVKAKPMSRGAYNAFRGWDVPENENPDDEGYLVEYADSDIQPELIGKAGSYVSWLSKAVFEKAYRSYDETDTNYYYAFNEGNDVFIGASDSIEEAKKNAETIKETMFVAGCFDMSHALLFLKSGEKVARSGWNGKGMYLFLVNGETVTKAISDCYSDQQDLEKNMLVLDAIYMKTADNKLVPWLASQADLLAEDWELVS